MAKLQGCTIPNILGTAVIIVGGTVVLGLVGGVAVAVGFFTFMILYLCLYIKFFPKFSKHLGYGEIEDEE